MSKFILSRFVAVLTSILFSFPALADEVPGYLKPFGIELGKPFEHPELIISIHEYKRVDSVRLKSLPKSFSLAETECKETELLVKPKPSGGFQCEIELWINKLDKRVQRVAFRAADIAVNPKTYTENMKHQLMEKYPNLVCRMNARVTSNANECVMLPDMSGFSFHPDRAYQVEISIIPKETTREITISFFDERVAKTDGLEKSSSDIDAF
ncbi:MAG: hypothetical protein HWE34_11985 [Methylocystaceae bacterium]|nr:hypothetical protein [Methylocystaceae bacterium]